MHRQIQALILTVCCAVGGVAAAEPAWQQPLDEKQSWSRLSFAGTLLVASARDLKHFDPSTGELIWHRDDLPRLAQFDVQNVQGTQLLAINQRLGDRGRRGRLQVIDVWTGASVWDSGELNGTILGNYPLPGHNMLVSALNLKGGDGDKAGIYLAAYTLDDGQPLWRVRLGGNASLPKHRSDASSREDFSGHPQPVVTADTLYLLAGDLVAIDLASGTERWRADIRASGNDVKRAYARPIVTEDSVYAAGGNSVYAFDVGSGKQRWKVKIGSAAMPQLELVDDLLVGRLGGNFSTGKEVVARSPFGAFAIDTLAGKLQWKWTKGRESITNLRVLRDQDLVMLADKERLYGLDLYANRKPKVVFEQKLEFKRKLGSADVAAKGVRAVGGLLRGNISVGGGSDRGDPPLEIDRYGDRLIVRAQYHVLAHDIATRETAWSIEFAPPGMNPLALVAMGAVTAYMVADTAGAAGAYGSGWDGQQVLYNTAAISSGFENAVAARYAAAERSRNLAFFLTKDDAGIKLAGIDLQNGSVVGEVPMAEKEPSFLVDAVGNRVYYFMDKSAVIAYGF